MRSLLVLALILFFGLGSLQAVDHCIVNGMYYYCQEYAEGWNQADATRSCRFASGSFRSGKCPAADRNGACKNKSLTKNRVWWQKYYKKTWTQMSYASMKTVCMDQHDGKTNIAEWIEGDPDNSDVKPFDPEEQFPYEKLSGLRKGRYVLAPKDTSYAVYPAMVTGSKKNNRYYELKFADGQKLMLDGNAKLQRYYWELGSEISCYNTFKGYWENGKLQKPGNSIFDKIEVAFDSGVTITMPSANCRDLKPWKYKGSLNPFYKSTVEPVKPTPQTDIKKPNINKPDTNENETNITKPNINKPDTNEGDDELDQMEKELDEMEKELNDF